MPPHLVTAEFIKLVRSRLAPGGIYVMNVVDNAQRPRFALSVIATLQTVFPMVELWADATPDPNERRATFVIAALAQPSPASQITLGAESTWRRWPAPHVKKLMSMLDAMVLTDDFAPVDRLIGVE